MVTDFAEKCKRDGALFARVVFHEPASNGQAILSTLPQLSEVALGANAAPAQRTPPSEERGVRNGCRCPAIRGLVSYLGCLGSRQPGAANLNRAARRAIFGASDAGTAVQVLDAESMYCAEQINIPDK